MFSENMYQILILYLTCLCIFSLVHYQAKWQAWLLYKCLSCETPCMLWHLGSLGSGTTPWPLCFVLLYASGWVWDLAGLDWSLYALCGGFFVCFWNFFLIIRFICIFLEESECITLKSYRKGPYWLSPLLCVDYNLLRCSARLLHGKVTLFVHQ